MFTARSTGRTRARPSAGKSASSLDLAIDWAEKGYSAADCPGGKLERSAVIQAGARYRQFKEIGDEKHDKQKAPQA